MSSIERSPFDNPSSSRTRSNQKTPSLHSGNKVPHPSVHRRQDSGEANDPLGADNEQSWVQYLPHSSTSQDSPIAPPIDTSQAMVVPGNFGRNNELDDDYDPLVNPYKRNTRSSNRRK